MALFKRKNVVEKKEAEIEEVTRELLVDGKKILRKSEELREVKLQLIKLRNRRNNLLWDLNHAEKQTATLDSLKQDAVETHELLRDFLKVRTSSKADRQKEAMLKSKVARILGRMKKVEERIAHHYESCGREHSLDAQIQMLEEQIEQLEEKEMELDKDMIEINRKVEEIIKKGIR